MKTIGVIGLGSIGIRHEKNLTKMGHRVPYYDSAPNIQSIKAFSDNFLMSRKSIDDILSVSDAVIICSPSSEHAHHLNAAVESGKHILIEKPIAIDHVDGVKESLLRAKAKNLVVLCGYNLRFHACVKQAKQWLSEGKIGITQWASVTLAQKSTKEPYLRDGVILNWSHEIDLALYLLGPAKVACAAAAVQVQDFMADIVLVHQGGAHSNIHLDYLTHPEIRATTIIGDKGQIAIDLVNNTACFVDLEGKREDLQLQQTWDQTYVDEMKAFLDRIDGKETLGCDGAEGLAVLEICLEARRLAGMT